MEYIVRSPQNKPDTVEVRYDCVCGCKPRARWQRGTAVAGHEHCCCGRVHFVGPNAREQMEHYLTERRAQGQDAGTTYAIETQAVAAPWGEPVSVAFGQPDKVQKHGEDAEGHGHGH